MKSSQVLLISAALLSLVCAPVHTHAEDSKPTMIHHLFTGPDGQTHVEEIEAKFGSASSSDSTFYKLGAAAGAELRRAAAGRVSDWHPAPRKQYVITLSGHGELEIAGGQKIAVGPGSIELVEDVTGKGHITRVVGTEERVTLQVPVAEK